MGIEADRLVKQSSARDLRAMAIGAHVIEAPAVMRGVLVESSNRILEEGPYAADSEAYHRLIMASATWLTSRRYDDRALVIQQL